MASGSSFRDVDSAEGGTAVTLFQFPSPGENKSPGFAVLNNEAVDEDRNGAIGASNMAGFPKNKRKFDERKEYWMPDNLCKVCYSCEEAFTMYKRKHHCRMCGRIFCNGCSSYYVDATTLNISNTARTQSVDGDKNIEGKVHNQQVRCCRSCYNQLFQQKSWSQQQKLFYANKNSVGKLGSSKIFVVDAAVSPGAPADKTAAIALDSPSDSYNTHLPIVQDQSVECSLSKTVCNALTADILKFECAPDKTHTVEPISLLTPNKDAQAEEARDARLHIDHLQSKAKRHLEDVVRTMMCNSSVIPVDKREMWMNEILRLARVTVDSVDPDVRNGDCLDIRPYVKIKIIPGGNIDETTYVDGVVFRKTVMHKQMLGPPKKNPRILLFGCGLEFLRLENSSKLASLDVIVEQEAKFTEILVEKIMLLKPDLILVERSVSRNALELLCSYDVVVMQNVKYHLLERIARMTGAVILPSTDQLMILQGVESGVDKVQNVTGIANGGLGVECGQYSLRHITDNPEWMGESRDAYRKMNRASRRTSIPLVVAPGEKSVDYDRILKNVTVRGSTYVYLEGCPAEKGCTLVLRGAPRAHLSEIKAMLKFSVMVAYHLRLEVSYYNNRFASMAIIRTVETPAGKEVVAVDAPEPEDDSDEEQEMLLVKEAYGSKYDEYVSKCASIHAEALPVSTSGKVDTCDNSGYDSEATVDSDDDSEDEGGFRKIRSEYSSKKLLSRSERYKLSISMDVDIRLPYLKEVVGMSSLKNQSLLHLNAKLLQTDPEEYQSLLVTSMLMTLKKTQRSRAEVKCLRFYWGEQDVALGQFLIESCFSVIKRRFGAGTGAGAGSDANSVSSNARNVNSGSHTPSSSTGNIGGNKKAHSGAMHTLSFAHRSGRIDIKVCPQEQKHIGQFMYRESDVGNDRESVVGSMDKSVHPFHLPIIMSSYCKDCGRLTMPHVVMCDETWKMSFGKFLEMCYYNRTARCRVGGCCHLLRDSHVTYFSCDGYMARFEFIPMHPYALRVRHSLPHPTMLLNVHIFKAMFSFSLRSLSLLDDFLRICLTLELNVKTHLASSRLYGDAYSGLAHDIETVKCDLRTLAAALTSETAALGNLLGVSNLEKTSNFKAYDANAEQYINSLLSIRSNMEKKIASNAFDSNSLNSEMKRSMDAVDGLISPENISDTAKQMTLYELSRQFPLLLRRGVYTKASLWNNLLEKVYVGSEQIKLVEAQEEEMMLQQELQSNGGGAISQMSSLNSVDGPGFASRPYSSNLMAIAEEGILQNSDSNFSVTQMRESFDTDDDGDEYADAVIAAQASSVKDLSPARVSSYKSTSGEQLNKREPSVVIESWNSQLGGVGVGSSTTVNTMTKAFAKFVLGKEVSSQSQSVLDKIGLNTVDLSGYMPGHYSMPTGRNGEVIAVSDSSLSSIIAYSLASEEYHRKYQEHMTALESDAVSSNFFHEFGTTMNDASGPTVDSVAFADSMGDEAVTNLVSPSRLAANTIGDGNDADSVSPTAGSGVMDFGRPEDYDDDEYQDDPEEHSASVEGKDDQKGAANPSLQPFATAVHAAGAVSSIATGIVSSWNNRRRMRRNRLSRSAVEGIVEDVLDSGLGDDCVDEDDDMDGSGTESVDMDLDAIPRFDDGPRPTVLDGASVNMVANFEETVEKTVLDKPVDRSTFANGMKSEKSSLKASKSSKTTLCDEAVRLKRENQLLSQRKTHIKHRFENVDAKGNATCKYICHSYWSTQFEALRCAYFDSAVIDDDATKSRIDDEHLHQHAAEGFVRSLSASADWQTTGGKSGAAFSKTVDDRFVVKLISNTELQMFLDFAPAYFEYMSKALYHRLPTALVKILGVYEVGARNSVTGKKVLEPVVVMENVFYQRKITKIFDLKGSTKNRHVEPDNGPLKSFEAALIERRKYRRHLLHYYQCSEVNANAKNKSCDVSPPVSPVIQVCGQTLLDDNFAALTDGGPFPLKHRAKVYFSKAVLNDTLFLSRVNIVDYSILVGFDEENHEIVVGIIDYMRQYDFIKRMERVGKSTAGLLTGQTAETTIIQPPQYKKRFQNAMERYFMTIPDKWLSHD